jgi:hypothetical protein
MQSVDIAGSQLPVYTFMLLQATLVFNAAFGLLTLAGRYHRKNQQQAK